MKEIFKLASNYLLSGIIMFIINLTIGILIKNNLISIIMQIITGIFTYGICLITLRDEFVFDLLKKILNKRFIK